MGAKGRRVHFRKAGDIRWNYQEKLRHMKESADTR